MELTLTINGFEVLARYSDQTVIALLRPFLQKLTALQAARGQRLIVFLAAPPATGKSTLAAFLEHLSRSDPALTPVQALGLDGFHYPQSYLNAHTALRGSAEIPLACIKGAPESFDVEKLRRALDAAKEAALPANPRIRDVSAQQPLPAIPRMTFDPDIHAKNATETALRWPIYDRRIHDVSDATRPVEAPILLLEGNWLLLDRAPWSSLPRDYTVFIRADESQLRDRLIARKMRGGLTRAQAEAYYAACDGPNVRLCLSGSLPANWNLQLNDDGDLTAPEPLA